MSVVFNGAAYLNIESMLGLTDLPYTQAGWFKSTSLDQTAYLIGHSTDTTGTGEETDVVGTSGIVDATTNLLTGASRTTYLGLKGHEVD